MMRGAARCASLSVVKPTKVFLLDEQRVFADALASCLCSLANVRVVGSAAPDDEGAAAALLRARPHVVAVEVARAGPLGALADRIAAAAPGARLMALTESRDAALAVRAALAGFDAWVSKDGSTETLLAAVRALRLGQPHYGPEQLAALLEWVRGTAGKPAAAGAVAGIGGMAGNAFRGGAG
jgi:two-component system nitrate/nitrite response regulator NarL